MKPEVGQVLSGTLRLVRKIADGGMGSVWVAAHAVLGTEVAVKLMSGPLAALPSARTRFLREARMTANVRSDHVVRVLDCRHDQADEPYLVLELLHGENLEQRVRRLGPLSIFEVEELVAQICDALAATHDAHVVHRDLKPENLFLVAGTAMFVKLLDYGVAKPMNDAECVDLDRLSAGTPQYMSPEHMFEPETTDARSDLFSLAAVAYFALTRRTPFDADSLEGLYFAIDGGTFARPSTIRPELSPAVDRWFEKALAHHPADRFESAGAMADALHAIARDARSAHANRCTTTSSKAGCSSSRSLGALRIPLRRMGRSRASALAAFVLATTASVLVWRSHGPDLHEGDAAPGGPEISAACPALEGARARTPAEPPARVDAVNAMGMAPASRGIHATTPHAAPLGPARPRRPELRP